jgi:predicted RNase H-like nuclease
MTAILAIDAAWTARQPSGVALVCNAGDTWRCVGLAPSYIQFEHLAAGDPGDSGSKPTASRPDLDRLFAVCRRPLDGEQVSLIAMDMPLSLQPITRRRAADDAVSRAYGNKGCAVHSPYATRPGRLADEVRARATTLDFPLAIGIRYLQRDSRAFGDRNAAIWIPAHADGRGVTTTCLRRA